MVCVPLLGCRWRKRYSLVARHIRNCCHNANLSGARLTSNSIKFDKFAGNRQQKMSSISLLSNKAAWVIHLHLIPHSWLLWFNDLSLYMYDLLVELVPPTPLPFLFVRSVPPFSCSPVLLFSFPSTLAPYIRCCQRISCAISRAVLIVSLSHIWKDINVRGTWYPDPENGFRQHSV